MNRGFLRAGHLPTLVAAFLYFDLSFMVWVLLGPLAVFIAKDLHLEPGQKGLMVATPVLAGAVLRIVSGVFADHLKPRLTGIIMQVVVIAGLAAFWVFGVPNFEATLALGIVLGVAGASFRDRAAAGILLVSAGASGNRRWASPARAIRAPCLPRCSRRRSRCCLAGATCSASRSFRSPIVLASIRAGSPRTAPDSPPRKSLDGLRSTSCATSDAWWLMCFYSVTFGGFVGLSSFLPIYFNDQYALLAGHRRLFHGGLRLRRLLRPAVRRRARRPHRRRQGAELRLRRLSPSCC